MDLSRSDWTYAAERAGAFVGREWVFARVRSFLSGPPGTFLLRGDPGTGKTAVAARLAQASCGPLDTADSVPPPVGEGAISAGVFCQAGKRTVSELAQRLSDQLAASVDGFANALRVTAEAEHGITIGDVSVAVQGDVHTGGTVTGVVLPRQDGKQAFNMGVAVPLRQLRERGATQPIVLLVDAVDEAADVSEVNAFSRLLGTLEGIHLIVTCRSDPSVLSAFRAAEHKLDLTADTPVDNDDVRLYIRNRLTGQGPQETVDVLVDRVSGEADGNFLYAFYVTGTLIRSGSLAGIDEKTARGLRLPTGGLAGVYQDFLDRQIAGDERRWAGELRPVLAPLCVALGDGFTTAQLAAAASRLTGQNFPLAKAGDVTRAAGQFLDGPRPSGPFRVYHQSFSRFLTDPGQNPNWPIDLTEANRAVAQGLIDTVPEGQPGVRDWAAASTYVRRHLTAHAAECGRFDDLTADAGFLLCAEPPAVLRWQTRLTTDQGLASLAAYQLSLGESRDQDDATRAWWLHTWARKTRADRLAESAAELSGSEWVIGRAWWSGTGHQALHGYRHGVLAVAIGQVDDTDVAVFGGEDGTLGIWDPDSNATQTVLSHNGAVLVVAVGRVADTDVIASGSRDTVRIWDAGWRNEPTVLTDYQEWSSIAIGRLNHRDVVAFGGRGGTLRIWDFGTRSELPMHDKPPEGVHTVAIGRINNQDVIVTGGAYHTIRIWFPGGYSQSFAGPARRDPWSLSNNMVSALTVGRINGRDVVVSGDEEGTVRVWDPSSELEPTTLSAHDQDVQSVVIYRIDGRDVIISAGQEREAGRVTGSVRLWDLTKSANAPVILMDYQLLPYDIGNSCKVRSMAVGHIGGRDVVVSGGDDQRVRIRNLGGPPEPTVQWGQHGGVTAVTVGAVEGQDVIVSASADGTLRILDPIGNAEPITLTGHDKSVDSIAVGQVEGEDVIVSAGSDRTVRIWHPAGYTEPIVIHSQIGKSESGLGQVGTTTAVIGRVGDMKMIVVADDNGTVVLGRDGRIVLANNWPGQKRLAVGQLAGRNVIVTANHGTTAFLRNPGANAREVQIWDPATDDKLILTSDRLDKPESIAVGRFGERDVIAIANTGSLLIWDPITRIQLAALPDYHNGVWHAAVCEMEGQEVIVTAGADSAVRIWKWGDDSVLLTELTGHVGPIDAMTVGKVGGQNSIVTGHRDGTALLWLPRRRAD